VDGTAFELGTDGPSRILVGVDGTDASMRAAAYAAGLAVGFWPNMESLRANWHRAAEWLPRMEPEVRAKAYRKWTKAVARAHDWVDDDD